MNKDESRVEVGSGYPLGQLAKAFVTAVSHEDAETRRRADERVSGWNQVLAGTAAGRLRIGSRTPVSGLPGWVTLAVLRDGFGTGKPLAGGPIRPHETELAQRVRVRTDRRALFAYHLTEPGLARLGDLLDSGRYRIDVPEEAALLVVAWLLRSGDRLGALTLLNTLFPLAARLRFAPAGSDTPVPDPEIMCRETVAEVRHRVAARRPNQRVEALNEALTVWNPFGDDLLALWLETMDGARVDALTPIGWTDRAAVLLDRYRTLAAEHTLCSKHRKPKENLAILRAALEEAVAARTLSPSQRGLLQHAVDSMVRRRGSPGTERHTQLRTIQAEQAAKPTHHALARIVLGRLTPLPPDTGVRSPDTLTLPVDTAEALALGVAEGASIPDPIRRLVARARAGTIEELVEHGLVPSAEVLARFVPQLAAAVTAAAYPDPALRLLMAANYQAFRRRRSVLLLNLEHQVRVDELPWVARVLRGSLYERYYGIHYTSIVDIDDVRRRRRGAATSDAFDALCRDRAGVTTRGFSVATNGTIIERAQIFTTHNLATMAGPVAVTPSLGWAELAQRSLQLVCRLVARVHRHPRPLSTIKDAAYAWRQLVLYLSLSGPDHQVAFVGSAWELVASQPEHVQVRLSPVLSGLAHVAAGGAFGADGIADGGGRRFLGWTTTVHWLADAVRPVAPWI